MTEAAPPPSPSAGVASPPPHAAAPAAADAAAEQPGAADAEELLRNRTRQELVALRNEMFAADPDFKLKPLTVLNAEALAHLRAGDDARCIAAFAKFFRKLQENNLTHRELYVAHCNRASAYLNLGLYEEALWDARRAAALAEAQFARTFERSAAPAYVKSFARKGWALLGLRQARAAKAAFEEGLALSAFNEELKRGADAATAALLAELSSGAGRQRLALPAPGRTDRISYLPYSAPLHALHPRELLPTALLTPRQAEHDHDVKDTYNYMTVSADVRVPARHATHYLTDARRVGAFEAALARACGALRRDECDARVLHLGAGAGLLSLLALRHGAAHVVAAERWLYLASAARECLAANGVELGAAGERARVVYKRPTDLLLTEDVPAPCNVLLLDGLLEDGLLAAGLIPAVQHAQRARLLLPNARMLPAAATVYVQAVQVRIDDVAGFDCSAANLWRWHPSHTCGATFDGAAVVPLSAPVLAWHFDFYALPETSESKTVDVPFIADGTWNAVLFWYDMDLGDGATLSTGPDGGLRSLRPALQYLPGEMPVEGGRTVALRCSHNTVRLHFMLDEAEYTHLYRADASFPPAVFSVLADRGRADAYAAAITRQVARRRAEDGEVHALDLGAGSGLLAMMAARAGADSVVAAEIHPGVAELARRVVSANGLSETVSVVARDAALLQRCREVRPKGANLVVMDLFDAGLFGHQVLPILEQARRAVLAPGAVCVPAAATLYCMGVEAVTGAVRGFDMGAVDQFRWDAEYHAVRMGDLAYKPLTKPKKVMDYFFLDEQQEAPAEAMLKLELVAAGHLNAVCFWFDLHLDDAATISNAPPGVGRGGALMRRPGAAHEPADADAGADAGAGADAPPGGGSAADGAPAEAAAPDADALSTTLAEEASARIGGGAAEEGERHHWGQALQYLERAVRVAPALRKVSLLLRMEKGKLTFSLREGVGDWVPKAPWRITWGGGASIESPHFQRVHYCELLVREFLMRVRCRRFPPIEKDMKMVLAHGGALFLDPRSLSEVYRHLVTLEALHLLPEMSAFASVEAISGTALELC